MSPRYIPYNQGCKCRPRPANLNCRDSPHMMPHLEQTLFLPDKACTMPHLRQNMFLRHKACMTPHHLNQKMFPPDNSCRPGCYNYCTYNHKLDIPFRFRI